SLMSRRVPPSPKTFLPKLSPSPAAARSTKRAGLRLERRNRGTEHKKHKRHKTSSCASCASCVPFCYSFLVMCGIFGYVGPRDPVPVIMGGLRSLEYRGYDSAGIAIIDGENLQVRRSSGKLKNLEQLLLREPVTGQFVLGHTRWA